MSEHRKIIVAGSRDFDNFNFLAAKLSDYTFGMPSFEIVSGGARGADTLGEEWAKAHNVHYEVFKPDWNPRGYFDRTAGFKRNIQMAEYATDLVAFWDGESRGTRHMIEQARKHNLQVTVFVRKTEDQND